MAKSPLTLLVIFVGVFLLGMVFVAGIASLDKDDNTNLTETQDLQSEQHQETLERVQPFIIGLGAVQLLLLVVLIFGGLAFFASLMFRRRRG